jgi:uncharacterized membrane protein YdjX (TVP38/TMEM64 family)
VNKRLLALYALIVVCIIGLTIFVEKFPISNFDLDITRAIQEQRAWDPTLFMRFVSIFGDAVVAPFPVIIASLLFFRTYRRREARFTLAVILADLCNFLIMLFIMLCFLVFS